MVFNSLVFFVFFTVVYAAYRRLPHRGQNWLLLVASYVFYGWWDWRFAGLLAATSFFSWGSAEACAALISDEGRGDESVEELLWLERKRNWRKQLRPRTRTWADWFAWGIIAGESRVVHAKVFV